MGKGDKRTKRGKIFKASFGKARKHEPKKKLPVIASKPKEKSAAKSSAARMSAAASKASAKPKKTSKASA